jgi:hypothetical protein
MHRSKAKAKIMQHCFADDAQVAGIAHSFVILNLFQDDEPQSHVIPITVTVHLIPACNYGNYGGITVTVH